MGLETWSFYYQQITDLRRDKTFVSYFGRGPVSVPISLMTKVLEPKDQRGPLVVKKVSMSPLV